MRRYNKRSNWLTEARKEARKTGEYKVGMFLGMLYVAAFLFFIWNYK